MYEAKDFSGLLGLAGFSDTLLNNHFTLYQGYVANVNTLLKKMNEIRVERGEGDDTHKEESAELHRRYGWEYNGMKLHELYFENMSKSPAMFNSESALGKLLVERFGSYEAFQNHFSKNVGMFRGIGWVALVKRDDTLGVIWIGEHDEGLLANSKILLIMDVFEHAFMVDYGLKRADYITAFLAAIDWSVVESRLM
jgi:Fe-Mn family superoxide dismutase